MSQMGELENAERAAGLAGEKKADGEKGDLSGGSDDNENDNEMGSDSDESVDNLGTTSSRESSPPSTTPSPRSQKNGASLSGLDFSRSAGGPLPLPASSPPSMISPLSSRKHGHNHPPGNARPGSTRPAGDSPLDLSVSHKKKEDDGPVKKLPKWSPSSGASDSSLPSSTPLAANHHPHNREVQHHRERKNSWNGNHSPDIKALEKMSEMSRSGEAGGKLVSPSGRGNSGSSSSWQAQWLAQNTGSREIFKCVVCRNTFSSLQALSLHMKESKHGPPMPNLPSPKMTPQQSPGHSQPLGSGGAERTPERGSGDSSLLLKGTGGGHKETVQLPRKLVRGQDVWLGKGAEQTRQILKCMWCGQSFRSLAEMTSHMQQTQHYTNIISQEQLISWRSSDDKGASSANSHVSAVLTCKVCDQAFSSLKELSNHMVKNSHYKEHIMRSITESGSRRRQSREKRKKSLPVRKLLELERANQEMKKEIRISCEKCSEKIPGPLFVEHLRICGNLHSANSNSGSGASSGGSSPLKQPTPSPKEGHSTSGRESCGTGELDLSLGSGSKDHKTSSEDKNESSAINAIEKMIEKSFDYRGGARGQSQSANLGPSPPSHIGTRSALESTLTILKRLGIDESVDYTKPLLDPSQLPQMGGPPGKYSSHHPYTPRGRSRSRSESSDKSFSEEIAARGRSQRSNSKSNSNSSSPALHDHESGGGSHSIKSPLSLNNSSRATPTPIVARSPGGGGDSNVSTDVEGDGLSDEEQAHDRGHERAHDLRREPPPGKGIPIKSSPRANNHNNNNKKPHHPPQKQKKVSASSQNSLSALSSMFESIGGGTGRGSGGGDVNSGEHNHNAGKNSGFPSNSHHPLAALQKLCDKTENTPGGGGGGGEGGRGSVNSRPTSTSSSNPQSSPEPSLLGLNWATAAANASGDGGDGSVFKCTFCESPFLSKGSYRLHLAKMHFVKESSKSPHAEVNANNGNGKELPGGIVEPTINSTDSPASKLIKYAELAKQLSSK